MKPAPRVDFQALDTTSNICGSPLPPAKVEFLVVADYLTTGVAFTPYAQPALLFDGTATVSSSKTFTAIFSGGTKGARAYITRNNDPYSSTVQSDTVLDACYTESPSTGTDKYQMVEDAAYESTIITTGDIPSGTAGNVDKVIAITEDKKPVLKTFLTYHVQGVGLYVPEDQQTVDLESL